MSNARTTEFGADNGRSTCRVDYREHLHQLEYVGVTLLRRSGINVRHGRTRHFLAGSQFHPSTLFGRRLSSQPRRSPRSRRCCWWRRCRFRNRERRRRCRDVRVAERLHVVHVDRPLPSGRQRIRYLVRSRTPLELDGERPLPAKPELLSRCLIAWSGLPTNEYALPRLEGA